MLTAGFDELASRDAEHNKKGALDFMSSALDKLFASAEAAPASRDLKVVASFKADVKRDSKGNPGFSIRPILADGTEGRFGDMWIRLAEGPATLRAFKASMASIYAAIEKLDAYMVEAGEWKAAPAKDAAPAAKPAAAKAKAAAAPAPAPAAAPEPVKDIFADLPF